MPRLPNLKQVRERRLITQEQLGEKSGIHAITISRLESGKGPRSSARFSTIRKLADALGVEPAELMGDGNSPGAALG